MAIPIWAVRNFSVSPAVHGPQVIINWDYENGFDPTDVLEIRLVRRERFFPVDESDGTLLLAEVNPGPPNYFVSTYFTDLTVQDGLVYYYSMFSNSISEGGWVRSDLASGYALGFTTGAVASKIWQLLNNLDQSSDASTEQKILTERVFNETDSVNVELEMNIPVGQKLHFGAHEILPGRGFLFRLLQLLATEFDRVHALTGHLHVLWDVDKAPLDMLPVLGSRVGVTIDVETTPERRRLSIKQAVPVYHVKGTRDGIHAALQPLIPWEIQFNELGDNILVFNRQDRVFWNEPDTWKMGTVDDTTDYFPGTAVDEYNFNKVAFFFISPSPSANSLTPSQIAKAVQQTIPANLQATHIAIPIFVPADEPETSRLEIHEVSHYDEAHWLTETSRLEVTESTRFVAETSYLMTGDAGLGLRVLSDTQWILPKRRV